MSISDQWSQDFRTVLNKELDTFANQSAVRLDGALAEDEAVCKATDDDPFMRAHNEQLVGLAFSGGGIRSATFNLGVLQSLAHLNLLSKFNYLSTVSGGGYIGSWLIAWMKRATVGDVQASLRPQWGQQPGQTEPHEIHFLRRFSNYLTPKLGWLGADMWTVVAIYVRNLILNLIILSAAFAFILLVPRWIAYASRVAWQTLPNPELFRTISTIALIALAFATYFIVRSMRYFVWAKAGSARKPVCLSSGADGWKSKNGKCWYSAELFGDFILRLEFTIGGSGTRSVYLWDAVEDGEISGPPTVEIVVANEQLATVPDTGVTGTINNQPPARRAELKPGANSLEITCSGDACTVRVNDLTINTVRLRGRRKRRSARGAFWRYPSTAIGYDEQPVMIGFENVTVEEIELPSRMGTTQGEVQRRIILPLFVAAFLSIFLFGFGDQAVAPQTSIEFSPRPIRPMREAISAGFITNPWSWWKCAGVAGVACALLVLIARLVQRRRRKYPSFFRWRRRLRKRISYWLARVQQRHKRPRPDADHRSEARQIACETTSIGAAAAVGGIITWALYLLFRGKTLWTVIIWGTPSVIGAFLLTIVLHVGFLGRSLPDERREWWSRLNAWLLIYALGWIAIFWTAFYAPAVLRYSQFWTRSISFAWIASTISGLVAARSASTGFEKSSKLTELIAKMAPYVFVVGFFFFLSWAVDAVMPLIAGVDVYFPEKPKSTLAKLVVAQWAELDATNTLWPLLIATAGSFLTAAILSLRLDINQFSMHMLYRNRLGRCYLGASNRFRRAQPFTGFSAEDDFKLEDLANLRFGARSNRAPYPIINAALNLVGGKELAWQQRKAASFVFTPLYCGYEFPELPPGYCDTARFASRPVPVTLATAMAISGAAASPNMGYHTSPAPAFLMTVFNVRLGWWLGNPRQPRGWEKSGPLNVLWSLICELFGLTSDEAKYIYLSDGGHFENLGIYELVRRRCRFIVACDAEEDHLFRFNGLGNAIEKCRADFGIDIDIDVETIRDRSKDGNSKWHCAIGRIYYSRVDKNGRDGLLIYLKSSLTGDEPTDVLRYAAENPGFPHQSTADQWFDESQFESYRVLGYHIAENVFGAIGDVQAIQTVSKEQYFVNLAQHWYPPSPATAEAFTKHTRTVVAIYDQLRENPNLAFLSEYIYPEWRVLFEKTRGPWLRPAGFALDANKSLLDQLSKSEAELRAGFYICNSVFQLFEDVYVDLKLENEFDHPDNRGWMNFFRHWSWVPMFRVAWTISASSYGARFQVFCERHLDLKIGKTSIREVNVGKQVDLDSNQTFKWTEDLGKVAKRITDAIWTWRSKLSVGSNVITDAVLTVDQKAPSSKRDPKIKENDALQEAKNLIEEALQARRHQTIAIRTSNRIDEEWYASSTLLEMNCRQGIDDELKREWAGVVAALALYHGALVASRVFSDDFQAEFNTIERELIEYFFIFNPSLAASARLFRLEITPDPFPSVPTPRQRNLHFPFGFAILAKTEGPQRLSGKHKLVYFRVQDHLRRMGIARQALEQLIGSNEKLQAELYEMHPNAAEVPTADDRLRFLRLFDSVETATVQARNRAISLD